MSPARKPARKPARGIGRPAWNGGLELRAKGVVATVRLIEPKEAESRMRTRGTAVLGLQRSGGHGLRIIGGSVSGAKARKKQRRSAPELTREDAAPGSLRFLPRTSKSSSLPLAARRHRTVGFLGMGTRDSADVRRAGSALGRSISSGIGFGPAGDRGAKESRKVTRNRARVVAVEIHAGRSMPSAMVASFVEAVLLSAYTASMAHRTRLDLRFVLAKREHRSIARIVQRCAAVWFARDLANTPGNIKSPMWLAQEISARARRAGVEPKTLSGEHLRELGAGGLLAVGRASEHDPLLLTLRYRPASPVAHAVLVGKGITFDSGGLSLKPAASMALMKTDMSGAAAVGAAVCGAAELAVPVAITAYLAIAENMLGSDAMRPGDVAVHPDGRTTEILNTDAEGRLVLADALALAGLEPHPDVPAPVALVDLATLTGAATMALSRHVGAAFSRDAALLDALIAAGDRSGDTLWSMPLVDDYAEVLESQTADSCNVAADPAAGAGAITAALFLEPFAPAGVPWAHLDIAGPARAESDRDLTVKGATGFGVRLLLEWLDGLARTPD